jgi:DNA gyrase/topoisomerase IV subunit B
MATKQIYRKVDQIQHVLTRPDMYVGSVIPKQMEEFVVVDNNYKIDKRTIVIAPALIRIFIEPISNIIDNVARSKGKNKMTRIEVIISEDGNLTFWNDGEYIPIEIHNEEKCYNHSLIFGNLLAGSNFDDEDLREGISGKNGIGAKACSVFSLRFEVEGVDPKNKKKLNQVWTNNLKKTEGPVITPSTEKRGYTIVSFLPEYYRFGVDHITEDVLSIYKRIIVDMAMITNVPVFFNGVQVPVHSLLDYSRLYNITDQIPNFLHLKTPNCEVVVTTSDSSTFEAISFANGIYTPLGGVHVDSWAEAVFRPIVEKFNKPNKPQINIADVKKFFRLFVTATVPQPVFDSQSKTRLEAPQVEAPVKKTQISKIFKWPVIEQIANLIRVKELSVLKKTERKKRGYEKVEGLESANNEGTRNSYQCVLILVEGLSAKTYAMHGMERGVFGHIGRDNIGCLALRGKILNTRNANPLSISKNKVVEKVIKAVGISTELDYTLDENYKKLRYGRILSVCDADSVTGNTPLLLKDNQNNIVIKKIEDLCQFPKESEYEQISKEYGTCPYSVWTEKGWTKIQRIMRHWTNKTIYRVTTEKGLVEVTEDHSLLLSDSKEVSPRQIASNMFLLHSLPQFDEKKVSYANMMSKTPDVVSVKEAFIMGVFYVGDGQADCFFESDSYYPYCYWEVNHDKETISLVHTYLRELYPKLVFTEIGPDNNINLFLNIDITPTKEQIDFCKKYNSWMENVEGVVHIPDVILNCYHDVRRSFFNVLVKADLDFIDRVEAQKFYLLARSLNTPIAFQMEGEFIFYEFENPVAQLKISRMPPKEQYVYDLETENHHFQAGLGELIVHNTDGIHITGLIQNMFHSLYPTLLQRDPPFITAMQTPIVRVYLNKNENILFYDEREYRKYVQVQEQLGNTKINKKYYKGLGSSNEEDVAETFGQKIIEFVDDENTLHTMNMVFRKKYSDMRKKWLEEYDPTRIVLRWNGDDRETLRVSFADYLNMELIKFSIDDCKRSIPSLMDGLKEGHRKVLYTCFLRNLKFSGKTIKVAQLAGSVAEKSAYHHGETNLHGTITNMAAAFVGSNNIPLLFRDGIFGSRQEGGEDAAEGRYIWTKLDMLTRYIFRVEDDDLLDYIDDDGEKVEPKYYAPIIPMILVNGCIGIGTGWSSNIPCYHPIEIIENIKSWLNCDGKIVERMEDGSTIHNLPELTPWYRGYKGNITKESEGKYISWGIVERVAGRVPTVHVSELPVGMWTSSFIDFLEDLVVNKDIAKFQNHSTPYKIDFTIFENKDGSFECNEANLKLFKYFRTTNMVLFDAQNILKKYANTTQIIDEYCQERFKLYILRKARQLRDFNTKIKLLGNKKRFLEYIRDGVIKLFEVKGGKRESRKTTDIVKELEEKKFDKSGDLSGDSGDLEESDSHGYDYLLKLQISHITSEKINRLQNEIDSAIEERDLLERTTEKQIWISELDELSEKFEEFVQVLAKEKCKAKK